MVVRVLETVEAHCGYHFPWSLSNFLPLYGGWVYAFSSWLFSVRLTNHLAWCAVHCAQCWFNVWLFHWHIVLIFMTITTGCSTLSLATTPQLLFTWTGKILKTLLQSIEDLVCKVWSTSSLFAYKILRTKLNNRRHVILGNSRTRYTDV